LNRRDWVFAQISDLQFGMMRPGADDYDETPLVVRAVARLNELGPDFVLCTGDLVEVPGSDRQMDHACSVLRALDPAIPFIPVPGNHDIGDVPTAAALTWFRARYRRDRCSFDHCGWHFVGLNSCLLADGSGAPAAAERQWAWLAEDLARAARAEGMIAFMHHPPFLDHPDEEDDYFNLPRDGRNRCLELLQKSGVGTVFSGHLHRCHEVSAGDLELVSTGPVGMPLQDGESGFRLVRVGTEGVSHCYFGLEDEAGQREFMGRG
jgi:3',5'-cyclic AMP phosphodiesterase CpdA